MTTDREIHDGTLKSGRLDGRAWQVALAWGALLIAPLLLALAWGAFFDPSVYVTLRQARDQATEGGAASLGLPLYVLALWLLAGLGVRLTQVALVLSALGWGVAALAAYSAGQAVRRPVAALVAAALLVFNPLVVSTLGAGVSWVVAWAWVAIAASMRKRRRVQGGALLLMLWTHLDWGALALAALLLFVQWRERRRFPFWPGLALALTVLGWGLATDWQPLFSFSPPDPAAWGRDLQGLVDESEFYWLFLPLIGLGLLDTVHREPSRTVRWRKTPGAAWWAGVLGGVVAVLSGDGAAGAMMMVAALFLAGLGIEGSIRWVETNHVVRLDRFRLALSLTLVAGLPLGLAQASTLWQRYQFRPVARQALEQQAGDWLRAHSDPAATIFGSQRVGYLGERATWPWEGTQGGLADLAALLGPLAEEPPQYCVSFRSIAWERMLKTDWFQDSYTLLETFESPHEATSPFEIWGHRFSGEVEPLGARFGERMRLVSSWVADGPSPGSELDLRLYWLAQEPPGRDYVVFVHLLDEQGQFVAGHDSAPMDGMRPTKSWVPGMVVPDLHRIALDHELPAGTYHLQVGMYPWPDLERLPIWDSQGVEQPNGVIVLGSVQVR
ncbi:MAG: hypothetical protein PVF45_04045 [Anaerolineae bacterium]